MGDAARPPLGDRAVAAVGDRSATGNRRRQFRRRGASAVDADVGGGARHCPEHGRRGLRTARGRRLHRVEAALGLLCSSTAGDTRARRSGGYRAGCGEDGLPSRPNPALLGPAGARGGPSVSNWATPKSTHVLSRLGNIWRRACCLAGRGCHGTTATRRANRNCAMRWPNTWPRRAVYAANRSIDRLGDPARAEPGGPRPDRPRRYGVCRGSLLPLGGRHPACRRGADRAGAGRRRWPEHRCRRRLTLGRASFIRHRRASTRLACRCRSSPGRVARLGRGGRRLDHRRRLRKRVSTGGPPPALVAGPRSRREGYLSRHLSKCCSPRCGLVMRCCPRIWAFAGARLAGGMYVTGWLPRLVGSGGRRALAPASRGAIGMTLAPRDRRAGARLHRLGETAIARARPHGGGVRVTGLVNFENWSFVPTTCGSLGWRSDRFPEPATMPDSTSSPDFAPTPRTRVRRRHDRGRYDRETVLRHPRRRPAVPCRLCDRRPALCHADPVLARGRAALLARLVGEPDAAQAEPRGSRSALRSAMSTAWSSRARAFIIRSTTARSWRSAPRRSSPTTK